MKAMNFSRILAALACGAIAASTASVTAFAQPWDVPGYPSNQPSVYINEENGHLVPLEFMYRAMVRSNSYRAKQITTLLLKLMSTLTSK